MSNIKIHYVYIDIKYIDICNLWKTLHILMLTYYINRGNHANSFYLI